MTDIRFTYEITKYGLQETTNISLYIKDFRGFVKKNIYHEIRTRVCDDDETEDGSHASDLRIVLKMNFHKSNDIFDIYYQSFDRVVCKSNLLLKYVNKNYNNSSIKQYYSIADNSGYHNLEAYKWNHITRLFKPDFTNYPEKYPNSTSDGTYMQFQFKVIIGSDELTGTLSNDFEYLLKNNLLSDVNVVSTEQVEYKVHKAILASRSAVFKAHFEHNTTECLSNVVESPLESEVLKEVLTFIYSDRSPRVNEITDKLLPAADYYQLSRLKSMCEEALRKKLTVNNAIETLQLAVLYSSETLKHWTLEFIKDQAALITKTESWAKIDSVQLIKMIFEFMVTDDLEEYNMVNDIQYYEVNKE